MSEKEDAIALANKVLDTPNRDPDDDLSMMCRQFMRATERADAMAPVCDSLIEILAILRKEAVGTPLNNHRFDHIGIAAYAALAKAGRPQ